MPLAPNVRDLWHLHYQVEDCIDEVVQPFGKIQVHQRVGEDVRDWLEWIAGTPSYTEKMHHCIPHICHRGDQIHGSVGQVEAGITIVVWAADDDRLKPREERQHQIPAEAEEGHAHLLKCMDLYGEHRKEESLKYSSNQKDEPHEHQINKENLISVSQAKVNEHDN
jgi:hypothetical protein